MTVTTRQRQILDFIAAHRAQHGRTPLQTEIAAHLRLSTSRVHQLVETLRKRGLVDRFAWRRRGRHAWAKGVAA